MRQDRSNVTLSSSKTTSGHRGRTFNEGILKTWRETGRVLSAVSNSLFERSEVSVMDMAFGAHTTMSSSGAMMVLKRPSPSNLEYSDLAAR